MITHTKMIHLPDAGMVLIVGIGDDRDRPIRLAKVTAGEKNPEMEDLADMTLIEAKKVAQAIQDAIHSI